MPELTPDQRARILEAFQTIDPYAYSRRLSDEDEAFYYDGYITLAGLLHVAKVIAEMRLDDST